MNKVPYTPLGRRILIKEDDAITKTDGGIIIPDSVQLRRNTGEVIAKGHESTFPFEIGDKVMYPQGSGTELTINKEKYILMFEETIEGIL